MNNIRPHFRPCIYDFIDLSPSYFSTHAEAFLVPKRRRKWDAKTSGSQVATSHLEKAGWPSLNICVKGNYESKKGLVVFVAE